LLNLVSMRPIALASMLVVPLVSGCVFLLDDDDDDCDYGGLPLAQAELAIPTPTYRNPDSGQCQELPGGPGGGECDRCGRCPPVTTDQAPEPAPDWGECLGVCGGLDEATCLATDACRAAYLTACIGGDCPDEGYAYHGCWTVAPAAPVRGGACEGLSAYECSRHDDCVARHVQIVDCIDCTTDPTVGPFESCAAEPELAARE
jgi:hypothetical protein